MLVKNLKCPQCGGIKINELTTGYIYCDYCSALMGYDMKMMQDEAKDVFSFSNIYKSKQRAYTSVVQKMANALKDENSDLFVEAQVELRDIEFDLFPKRFSPKAKQKAYRDKFLIYTKAFWTESIENGYFSKSKLFQEKINPLAVNLSSRIENGKAVYEYNENFEEYINVLNEFIKDSINESMHMKCLKLYPEPNTPDFDMFYKQGIDASLQMFDTKTAKKAINFLGIESEYITIDDIQLRENRCMVCNSKLLAPAGSKSMVCETCGNINIFEEKKIQCLSCAAPIFFENNNSCEYCGAIHISFEKESNEPKQTKKKSRGFLGKFFGV